MSIGWKCTCSRTLLSGIARFAHLTPGLENAAGSVKCPVMNENSSIYDVAVVGAGPAGLSAAIAIAQSGARTALIARRAPYGDNRTTAHHGPSNDILHALEVWRRCQDMAARLLTMRLVEDTGRLIRAP